MLTGLVIGALTAIGGGSDSVEPEYVDSVNFETDVPSQSETSKAVRDHVADYVDLFDMEWSDAYRWHLSEDNRDYGLRDVSERFDDIYEGVSLLDGDVIIWVSGPAKSGGIADLLDEYEIDAEVRLVPVDPDREQTAYRFVSDYGSAEYFAAEPNDDNTGLVISTESKEAAERGPELFGTVIDGVSVEYHWSE